MQVKSNDTVLGYQKLGAQRVFMDVRNVLFWGEEIKGRRLLIESSWSTWQERMTYLSGSTVPLRLTSSVLKPVVGGDGASSGVDYDPDRRAVARVA